MSRLAARLSTRIITHGVCFVVLAYRAGSPTPANMTPRQGRDTEGELRGLSAFDTAERAAAASTGPTVKVQVIETNRLTLLGEFRHPVPEGHISLRPETQEQLEEWAASRGADGTHPMTEHVIAAIIDEVRVRK